MIPTLTPRPTPQRRVSASAAATSAVPNCTPRRLTAEQLLRQRTADAAEDEDAIDLLPTDPFAVPSSPGAAGSTAKDWWRSQTRRDEFLTGAAFGRDGAPAMPPRGAAAVEANSGTAPAGPQKVTEVTRRNTNVAATPRAFVRLPNSQLVAPAPSTPRLVPRAAPTTPLAVRSSPLYSQGRPDDVQAPPPPPPPAGDTPAVTRRRPRDDDDPAAAATMHGLRRQTPPPPAGDASYRPNRARSDHSPATSEVGRGPCVNCGALLTDARHLPVRVTAVDDPDGCMLSGLLHLARHVRRLLGASAAESRGVNAPSAVLPSWPGAPDAVRIVRVLPGSSVSDACATAALGKSLLAAMLPLLPRRMAAHSDGSLTFWCRADAKVYELLWCPDCLPLPVLVGARVVAAGAGAAEDVDATFLFAGPRATAPPAAKPTIGAVEPFATAQRHPQHAGNTHARVPPLRTRVAATPRRTIFRPTK